MLSALELAVKSITKDWKVAKRQADRQDRVRGQDLDRLRDFKSREVSIREGSFKFMSEGYMEASANNTLPANARQISYSVRRRILRMNGKMWKKTSYFTQTLLPDYVESHRSATADWDVVFDARGHIEEPHTGERRDLGTLDVRRYIQGWTSEFDEAVEGYTVTSSIPTAGPANRYRFALFVEKEGFNELLRAARFAERYDLAIMSTKGMSVTAARQLVDSLSGQGVTVLVLHDFDKSGLSILHTLFTSSRRYWYRNRVKVIDLGLRLTDVQEMNLESEQVDYDSNVDPRLNLRASGATVEEQNFLVRPERYGGWTGERVELNAMASDVFVDFLDHKLVAAGVAKVVPDAATLEKAYRRAYRRAVLQKAIDEVIAGQENEGIALPPDLAGRVRRAIEGGGDAWDDAVWKLARESIKA